MTLKLFFLTFIVLFSLVSSYETEGDVLVLTDDDVKQAIAEYPYILVEFYAPWCGHCKSLTPVYAKAATALKDAGSEIKLAKVDADTHKTVAGEFGVRGFPSLYFFMNGTKIDYKGDRTQEGIIAWLNKKILPATTDLDHEAAYTALSGETTVSVVLFSTDASETEKFQNLARADDHNRYYLASGDLLKKHETGTVKVIRDFDEEATFTGDFDTLSNWIARQSRPALLPFDQRTIQSIFGEAKRAAVYINTGSDEATTLRTAFIAEAKSHTGDLIFSEIDKQSEHFERFADYIKVPVTDPRVVVVDGGKQKKYVQQGVATSQSISNFLKSVISGEATQYGLTDEIKDSNQATDDKVEGDGEL